MQQLEIFKIDNTAPPVSIPILGGFSAGFPSPATDYTGDRIDLNDIFIKDPGNTYYARVSGYYLLDGDLSPGDALLFDTSMRPRKGDLAVCRIDGEILLKFIDRRQGLYCLVDGADDHEEHPQSWYIEYSSSPVMNWWLPMYNPVGLGATAYFGYDASTGFAVNGTRQSDTSKGYNTHVQWHNAIRANSGGKALGSTIVYQGHKSSSYNIWDSWKEYSKEGITTSDFHRVFTPLSSTPYSSAGTATAKFLARCIRED